MGAVGCRRIGPPGESLRVGSPERLDGLDPLVLDRFRGIDMDRERRVKPDPGVVVPVIVIIEEVMAGRLGLLQ
ncbi:hypothetical protein ACFQ07_27700 [Actinomadura adrarensis]|uniref:Uncharacterized protein n=1 Tax=Actinomadura adrarensis TaxID=1819600 RepID=A0ABW3CNF3_9ACTN